MKLLHPLLHSPLADPQTDLCRRSCATLKFEVFSYFPTRSVSSPYYCVFVLLLMGESFMTYDTTTSPLELHTSRSTNKSL